MGAVEPLRTETTVEVVAREGADAATVAEIGERIELTPFEFRRPWMKGFVAVLARTGDVSSAARAAQINRFYVYEVKRTDAVFRQAWVEAEAVATDLMEQMAIRRATVGEEQVVTRTTRKFDVNNRLVEETTVEERTQRRSDALLMFMLRARRPDIYRERVDHRVTGSDGEGPVEIEVYRRPDPERLRELAVLYAQEEGIPVIDGTYVNGSEAAPDGP